MSNQIADNKTVKALRCIAHCNECSETEDCDYYMDNENLCDNISLARDTLSLIDRQKSENADLYKTINEMATNVAKINEALPKIRAEACNEFAEAFLKRLKREFSFIEIHGPKAHYAKERCFEVATNILKELLEVNKNEI